MVVASLLLSRCDAQTRVVLAADELLLEELSQELRSLLYERKFEKAVATIEEAMMQGKFKA